MAIELTQTIDGWTALDGRYRIFGAKGAAVLVVGPGPNATDADREVADEPLCFGMVDEAATWIESNAP